jgi:hypothetical protein
MLKMLIVSVRNGWKKMLRVSVRNGWKKMLKLQIASLRMIPRRRLPGI